MIQLISAPPRSGKSYFAVNYLCGFTKYDDLYNEYILSPEVLIISNIEGLKIKHWNLDYVLKDKPIEEFFTISNFESIMQKTGKSHIIIAIDECHKIFPNGYKNDSVYDFFAFHGHLGLDIILMTQGIQSMSRLFNPLLEYVIKVTPRSKKLFKAFSYKYYDLQGKFLYPKTLPTKDNVFRAYKSFRHDEQNKPRSAVKFWLVAVVCVFALGGGFFKYAISSVTDRGHVARADIEAPSDVASPAVSVAPVSNVLPSLAPGVSVIPETIWETIYLDGYAEKSGVLWYVYHGDSFKHDNKRFRNFDRISKTVEYFGKKILPDDVTSS